MSKQQAINLSAQLLKLLGIAAFKRWNTKRRSKKALRKAMRKQNEINQ